MSLAFRKNFSITTGMFHSPMSVKIANDRLLRSSKVFRGCTFDIYGKRFLIVLIPIPMGEINVIMGMD